MVRNVPLRYFVPQSQKRNDASFVALTRWDHPDGSDFCVEYLDSRFEEVVPDDCFPTEAEAKRRAEDVFKGTAIVWKSGSPPGRY